MKRTLAALSQNLGPEPLKALTEVIQTAFATSPPADEVAFSQLMELMSDFGMSQQCQDQVAAAIAAPIDFETIQSDPEVAAASILFQEQRDATSAIPTHWTQWQTWVVETMWTGWEFTLHIDRLGQVGISRPYLPDKAPSSPCLTVDLRSLLPASSLRADCPLSHQALTVQESAAVRAMRQEDVRSVHVHVNDAGQPQRLDLEHERQAVRGHRLEELLSRDGFEDLTLKVQNGQIVHARHITKHKLA